MPMRLEIVTAERVLFQGDVDVVVAPGIDGEIGILPKHAALMTVLQPGELRYCTGDNEEHFVVTGGFIDVHGDKVSVLADAAERADEIDLARAEEAVNRARQRIVERQGDVDLERALHSLRRAQVRLNVTRRRRGAGAPQRERGSQA